MSIIRKMFNAVVNFFNGSSDVNKQITPAPEIDIWHTWSRVYNGLHKPGVFVITHNKTGGVIVGSASDIYASLQGVASKIRHRNYRNCFFQKLLDVDNDCTIRYRYVNLRSLEMTKSKIISDYKGKGVLLNVFYDGKDNSEISLINSLNLMNKMCNSVYSEVSSNYDSDVVSRSSISLYRIGKNKKTFLSSDGYLH